jgi:hypothetical protein
MEHTNAASAPAVSEFERYARILEARLATAGAFAPEAESATAIQVERGIGYPMALLSVRPGELVSFDRLIELAGSPRLSGLAIVDRSGHHRPAYRALLVYSWLQSFRLAYETLARSDFGRWEEGLRPWCDLLEAELGEIDWPAGGMPAGRGASATESAWMALALFAAGKVYVRDAWTDLASDIFGKLVRSQQSNDPPGQFLRASAEDNPDSHGYHELVLLHAAASYAVQAEDRAVASAVARSTRFHLASMQPDHATNLPWAVFPFIWDAPSRPLADTILHASQMHQPTGDSPLALMLLGDALYCLRLFLKPSTGAP